MSEEIPDVIHKEVLLKAPPARVWQAVSDSQRFGVWFGAVFEGPFVAGQVVKGRMVPTQVDPDVAESQKAFADVPFDLHVQKMEPERLFSFLWAVVEPKAGEDPASVPMTTVEFRLAPAEGGTKLTITESGFRALPLDRRAKAFTDNEGGWAIQAKLISQYLVRHGA